MPLPSVGLNMSRLAISFAFPDFLGTRIVGCPSFIVLVSTAGLSPWKAEYRAKGAMPSGRGVGSI